MEALLLDASGVVNFFDVPDRGGKRKPLRVVGVEGARAEARCPVARAVARPLASGAAREVGEVREGARGRPRRWTRRG